MERWCRVWLVSGLAGVLASLPVCAYAGGQCDPSDTSTISKLCDVIAATESANTQATSPYAQERRSVLETQLALHTQREDALRHLPHIPMGHAMGDGVCNARVPLLRQHLEALGFAESGSASASCTDAPLLRGVGSYQSLVGIEPDEVAGPNTLAELNVPVERRIENLKNELALLEQYGRDPDVTRALQHNARTLSELQALRPELQDIVDHADSHSFGEVARAHIMLQRVDFRQSQADRRGGCGIFNGRRLGKPPRGSKRIDCTIQGVLALDDAYRNFGKYDEWRELLRSAVRESNHVSGTKDGLRMTVLMGMLVKEHRWQSILWAPDLDHPWDGDSEHTNAIRWAMQRGDYYSVPVNADDAVLNYRPSNPEVLAKKLTRSKQVWDRRRECKAGYPDRWTDSSRPADREGLERLRKIPFGILAARGGKHIAIILDGKVYEAHSRSRCTDPELIEVTDLYCWWWNSGVIIVPPDDGGL